MKSDNRILVGLSFLLFGILSLLNYFNIPRLASDVIYGVVFIFFGLITVYRKFGANKRGNLSFGVVVFLIGIVLIMKSHFDLLDTRGIVLTSILFIVGATFLILFLENTKEKAFLYSGLMLIILSIVTITWFKSLGLFLLTNKIGNYFSYFWPIILIIFGMSLFINRKR